MDITKGGGGFGRSEVGLHRKKMLVMPGIDAFFDPEPRLELMKEMGIDRTLLWPTLASAIEERVADDPDVAVAVIHALNAVDARALELRLLRRASTRRPSSAWPPVSIGRSRSWSSSTSAAPRSSSSGWRRSRRGRVGSRSPCPSSIRSGSGCRNWTSSSACTRATPATTATSTSGKGWATWR